MPQLSKVPPTPKLGSVSLPPDSPHDDTGKIFGGSRKRLTSFFGKAMPMINVGRSMTPVPAPVTRCEYPRSQPAGKSRPRASSMTNRPVASQEHALNPDLNAIMPRYSEPSRGGSSKVRQYPIDSMSQSWTASARPPLVASGRHQGPDTPKYMKATVKEVATKDESIVLSWPLVPYADRRQLKHPLLYYDVAFDPRDTHNVRDNRKTHFLALPEADRELPVSTHCTLTEMVIDCPLVGSLVVARPEGLRCIDVFYAIYCKYQKKPRSHERPADTAKYMPAFEQRCYDCPGLPEYNRRLGLLRVDLLRGKRIFEGLRRANGRWELIIDVPPKQRI